MFLTNCDRFTTNYDKSALINKKTVSNITYSALLNLPTFPPLSLTIPKREKKKKTDMSQHCITVICLVCPV